MNGMVAGSALLVALGELAQQAAAAILEVYGHPFEVFEKADHSPLTAADLAAQTVIAQGLARLAPEVPILSEEANQASWSERQEWPRYWLVDPLDGTREFVKRNGEFSVNIALIEDGRPSLGVVVAPVTGIAYLAAAGQGAWRRQVAGEAWQRLTTRALGAEPVVVGSRSHAGKAQAALPYLVGEHYQVVALGSSLKFCLIAAGGADLYLRLGATCEWDTAAAQCVLEEAGGAVLDLQGHPLRYNRGESLVNPEFIAVGDARLDWVVRLVHWRQAAESQISGD